MEYIMKYYKNTENDLPHPIVRKFIKMNIKLGKAVDLGCGAGKDTIYLIKNGWEVVSIDKENTKSFISNKLNNDELKRFRFSIQKFENINLEKNNLVIAILSIPLCNKYYFNEFWNKIKDSISKDGYFVGNFFGLNDSWAKTKEKMVFLTREQVKNLFEDSFDIILFNEFEKDAKTGLGKMKHCHIYNVIARKK